MNKSVILQAGRRGLRARGVLVNVDRYTHDEGAIDFPLHMSKMQKKNTWWSRLYLRWWCALR